MAAELVVGKLTEVFSDTSPPHHELPDNLPFRTRTTSVSRHWMNSRQWCCSGSHYLHFLHLCNVTSSMLFHKLCLQCIFVYLNNCEFTDLMCMKFNILTMSVNWGATCITKWGYVSLLVNVDIIGRTWRTILDRTQISDHRRNSEMSTMVEPVSKC